MAILQMTSTPECALVPAMGMYSIKHVSATLDAIDRLDWTANFATGFHTNQNQHVFILNWDGTITFYKNPIASTTMPVPQTPRMHLATRWVNRCNSSRAYAPGDVQFEFATDLPGNTLDRIERFRDGGRLFARLEGSIFYIASANGNPEEWFVSMSQIFSGRYALAYDVRTEPFELTRDIWCGEILKVLRPPGRHIVEVTISFGTAGEDAATRAIDHLNDAKRAFDEGRYAEVARLCYPALEELQKLADRVEQRYGKYGKDRLFDQVKSARSLCDPVRHGERSDNAGFIVDRRLAEHMIAFTSSIAGVILA